MHVCVYKCVCKCMYVYMYKYVCMYVCVYLSMYAYMCISVCVSVYIVCTHVWVSVCTCQGLRLISGIIFLSSSILFAEEEDLYKAQSPPIWLILLASVLWGFLIFKFWGYNNSWATKPIQHLCGGSGDLTSDPYACTEKSTQHCFENK